MYLLKNALRNIRRSKGRNILIGCIAFIIGISSCIALSIQAAAETVKTAGLDDLSINAQISVDRMSLMEKNRDQSEQPNMDEMKKAMETSSSLTLAQLQTYASAESVQNFSYTESISLNGIDDTLEAVSTTTMDGNGKGMPSMQAQADFTILGYSSDEAMESFQDGTSSIVDGVMFQEGDNALSCIISEELATLNNIAVNDTITLQDSEDESVTYEWLVTGIYSSTSPTMSGGMGRMMSDPANMMYTSSEAIEQVIKIASEKGLSKTASVSGTYQFKDVEAYEAFEAQARALGLSEEYTITSSDLMNYEQSLLPLSNLSTYAMYFLIVILVIGGAILIVLNIFNIRERKYEVGVLAAIGMNKKKVATQFVLELFMVTMLAIVLGTGVGAISSVPITNSLLSSQVSASSSSSDNFTRGAGGDKENMGRMQPGGNRNISYISEVQDATNIKVIIELLGIAILLTFVSSGMSVLNIMRYEPLKILANRE